MRKQTKIAAIVSAAALLAIGASMTSFAATGWQEEDGSWVYYNKNGEQVTDQWEKSGANWFYLDDDGVMATDQLIEYNDNYYYVDANGAMVTERWIAIDNEDAGEEDEPDVHWYYFQANGKALRKSDSHEHIFKKTLPGGKTYAFDSEGRMLYGWVRYSDGERQTGDTAWKEAEYYFGDENDGAMTVGWREIALTDDDAENAQPGDSFWDEDQVRWFYFKSSGKKENGKTSGDDPVGKGTTSKKVNGKKYGFDEYGRMIADWYSASTMRLQTATKRVTLTTPRPSCTSPARRMAHVTASPGSRLFRVTICMKISTWTAMTTGTMQTATAILLLPRSSPSRARSMHSTAMAA